MDHDQLSDSDGAMPEELQQLAMEHAEPSSSSSAVPRAPAPAVADGMTPDELRCVAMESAEAPSTADAASSKPRHSVSGPRAPKILQCISKLRKSTAVRSRSRRLPICAWTLLGSNVQASGGPGVPQTSEALQHAVEEHITETLVDASACALHARRVTVKPADFALLRKLRRKLSP